MYLDAGISSIQDIDHPFVIHRDRNWLVELVFTVAASPIYLDRFIMLGCIEKQRIILYRTLKHRYLQDVSARGRRTEVNLISSILQVLHLRLDGAALIFRVDVRQRQFGADEVTANISRVAVIIHRFDYDGRLQLHYR